MIITKVGLTVLLATAGLWLLSMSLAPAETDSAGSVQSTPYEQFVQTTDVGNLAGVPAEL